eukprot:UN34776
MNEELVAINEQLYYKIDELEQQNKNLIDSVDKHLTYVNGIQMTVRDSLMLNEQQDIKSFELEDSINKILTEVETNKSSIENLNSKELCNWEGTSCSCAADTGSRNKGYVIISTTCVDGVLVSHPSVIEFVTTEENVDCPTEYDECDLWSVDYSGYSSDPNCPADIIMVGDSIIKYNDIKDGEVSSNIECPDGFLGIVDLECNNDDVVVQDGFCTTYCPTSEVDVGSGESIIVEYPDIPSGSNEIISCPDGGSVVI